MRPPVEAKPKTPREAIVRFLKRHIWSRLPEGHTLTPEAWQRQHQAILVLLWLHAIGIACYGILAHRGVAESLFEGSVVAIAAVLAGVVNASRRFRAALASLGLLSSSAMLVHISGGFTEMHFHFFVIMVIIALYQDWFPFVLAVGYIVLEYAVVLVFDPALFYAGAGSLDSPWKWVGLHAAFVVAACVAGLVHWRLDESSHARADLILKSAGEGIYGIDKRGKTIFANPAAARMVGWDTEDVIDQPAHAVLRSVACDTKHDGGLGCPLYAPLADGSVHYVAEDVFRRRDGTTFPVEYIGTPIREKSEVVGAVVSFNDITERKRAEEQRVRLVQEEAARARAEEAIRARDDVLSAVSHDLKNPLGAMKGYAQLMRRRLAVSESAEIDQAIHGLEKIDATATQMTALIDELLDMVRLQKGEAIELNRRRTDLVALAREVAETYDAESPRHDMIVEASVPSLEGDWDAPRLKRALGNLIDNAIKYSAGGDITVRVRCEDRGDASWAVLAVRDQGQGIPAAEIPFIFERFGRVQHHPGGRIDDTGIGLASTKSIVERHGGTLSVDSEEGVGTTFTMRLPLPKRATVAQFA